MGWWSRCKGRDHKGNKGKQIDLQDLEKEKKFDKCQIIQQLFVELKDSWQQCHLFVEQRGKWRHFGIQVDHTCDKRNWDQVRIPDCELDKGVKLRQGVCEE